MDRLQKASYELRAVVCRDAAGAQWTPVSAAFTASLALGARFGTLSVRLRTPCGFPFHHEWPFCIDDADHVFARCMRPVHVGDDRLAIFLPNGDQGLFSRTRWVPHDAWVLRAAADANWSKETSWRRDGPHHRCLAHFFRAVHGRIRMRTAFRKLYFRCFRKAFAPGGRQAARALRAWEGDFSGPA